jgi:hypothetical protein
MTGHQDHRHLHREGQQVPETAAPHGHQFGGRLRRQAEGQHEGRDGQEDREDQGIRQDAMDHLGKKTRDTLNQLSTPHHR